MRLISVKAVLDIQGSVDVDSEIEVLVELNENSPYAILSHCWGAPKEEAQFKEMEGLARMDAATRGKILQRSGYQKILGSCIQARKDQLDWLWVDSCCINKESSSELSKAINSMFRWYNKSERCYAYLHDVDDSTFPVEHNKGRFNEFNGHPKWFSRGWTLQELVAPNIVHFFNQKWEFIGDKESLATALQDITLIPTDILADGISSKRPSVAQIMSWAADRKTTREEDQAYSLLGLLGVHMPMLYGEGKNAFRRLQEEIIRRSNDQSIFAWGHTWRNGWSNSLLADHPSCFRDCYNVVKMEPGEFMDTLRNDIPADELLKMSDKRLRTFSVTNAGIEIWLPLARCSGSASLFRAKLACRSESWTPVTIFLVCVESNYSRYFGQFETFYRAKFHFQRVFLPYPDDADHGNFTFEMDVRTLSSDGFSQYCVYPDDLEFSDDSMTLSNINDCAVIVYNHIQSHTGFAVALHYCFGQHLVNVSYYETSEKWREYAQEVHQLGRKECLEDILHGIKARQRAGIKHIHQPGSIRGVRLTYGGLSGSRNRCTVTIDVTKCVGCCRPNWQGLDDFDAGPLTLGLMRDAIPLFPMCPVYKLLVGSSCTRLLLADTDVEMKLGDYGSFQENGSFEREGNIFDLVTTLGIRTGSFNPVEHEIRHADGGTLENGCVKSVAYDWGFCRLLFLRNPTGLSIPDNQHIISLLKSLSIHLPDKALVTAVVKCSECDSKEDHRGTVVTSWLQYAGNKSAHDPPGSWKKLPTTTPLYTIKTPLIWLQETADRDTRTQFKEIRDNFHAIVDWVGEPDSPSREMKAWAAMAFLMDIFGGWHLTAFIGRLDFFDELPSIVATGFGGQHTVPTILPPATYEEKRQRVLRCVQLIKATLDDEEWYSTFASKLKSKVFGAELLRITGVTFMESQGISRNLRDPFSRIRSSVKKNDSGEGDENRFDSSPQPIYDALSPNGGDTCSCSYTK